MARVTWIGVDLAKATFVAARRQQGKCITDEVTESARRTQTARSLKEALWP
jgi:hypothetical protein